MTDPDHDLDAAYDNRAATPDAERHIAGWAADAEAFRAGAAAAGLRIEPHAYAADERRTVDLVHPAAAPRGLVVFVHGGYWRRFDGRTFSHMAAGCAARGWAVAVPTYRLAPAAAMTAIVQDVADAIEAVAGMIAGPIRIAGHSAGGHLAARMIAAPSPLRTPTLARVERVLAISGIYDLRPIRRTRINDDLRLSADDATAQSPALLERACDARVVAHYGATELPAFEHQARALRAAWGSNHVSLDVGVGANHFDVIAPLTRRDSALTAWLTEAA